jgi:hypothetical protein
MEFLSAPEGFSSEGGWWTDLSGATSALRGLAGEALLGPTLPARRPREGSVVNFAWTEAMSQAQLGDAKLANSVVFPVGVTAIGEGALYEFDAIESVVFPAGCIDIGKEAFAGCTALKAISLPAGCKATGEYAFLDCSSLVSVTIPAGCSTISRGCFLDSASLTAVRFPNGLRLIAEGPRLIGDFAFCRSALTEITLPDDSRASQPRAWRPGSGRHGDGD